MVQEQMRACDMLPKYAGVDARYQCTQFSWSEEFARPAAEVCAVVAQACRKHSYLIATTHFEPPLPFLVKARGMWATYYAGLTRTDNRISRTREMRRFQRHYGVAELVPDFYDCVDFWSLAASDGFILTTDTARSAEELLTACFNAEGIADCKRYLNSACRTDETVLVFGDYSGDFAIDYVEGTIPREDGDLCIASYMNFLIVNGGVIVPQYGDENDALALQQIQAMFPDRKAVGVDTVEVVYGGGNVHCITQQQPK